MTNKLTIEPDDSNDFGPCECCGNMSRTVWGYVHDGDTMIAVYYVQWTRNKPDHGAFFDLILGKWDDDSTPEDRQAVSLAYRWMETGGGFRIIDATKRPHVDTELASKALSREEVVGTPLAQHAYDVVDTIFDQDLRIAEIRGGIQSQLPRRSKN